MSDFFSDEKKENSEYELPDQIIVETTQSQKTSSQDKQERPSNKEPMSLRWVCFLGWLFCCIYGCGILISSLITTFFACTALFQNALLNRKMRQYWASTINTFVAGIGFMLGLIIPPLGLGFLVIYFSMQGEEMDTDILSKIIKHTLSR